MNTLAKVIVGFGLIVLTVLVASESFVRIYDGEVFDFPNHKLLIANNGFHWYNKTISYEFKYEAEIVEPNDTKRMIDE